MLRLRRGASIEAEPSSDREIVADGLFFPGALALGKKDEIYVTNCGMCFDEGEVLRISELPELETSTGTPR